jgi:hypothetical protein
MNTESKVNKRRREERQRAKREAKAERKALRKGKVIPSNAPVPPA